MGEHASTVCKTLSSCLQGCHLCAFALLGLVQLFRREQAQKHNLPLPLTTASRKRSAGGEPEA